MSKSTLINLRRKAILFSGLAGILALGGCATQSMQAADHGVMQAKAQAEQAALPPTQPVVKVVDTPWLMGARVEPKHSRPAFLGRDVTLMTQDKMTLQQIASQIATITGINVQVDPSVYVPLTGPTVGGPTIVGTPPGQPGMPMPGGTSNGGPTTTAASARMTVNYTGPLSGLLDQVDSGLGVYHRVREDGSILFFSTETKSFSIPALNWATSNKGQITSASSTGSSGGGGGAPGGASGGAISTNGTGQITVSNETTVDVWKSLQTTAQSVAGAGAQVVADSSNGMLIVTGTPPQMARVTAWVRELSHSLQRQVAIDVKVYSINLNQEDNFGFNPTVVFNNLGQRYGFKVAGAPAPAVSSGTTPFSFGANVLTPSGTTPGQGFYGSSAVLQALSTLGRTSLVISRSAVTLNGQAAPIQQALQTGYLASSSTTPSTASGVAPTTTLTPGSITTGFTAMVLPRVADGRIILGMNMTLSSLLRLNQVSSNGSMIQTPTVTLSTAEQSVALKPGQTLMLTGLQQAGNSTTDNGVGDPSFKALGGGRDTQHGSQMLVIMVTARLI